AMGRECGRGTVLDKIELNPETLATAKAFVAEAKLQCDVRFHQGAALDVIPRLSGPFDFVFIDCVKTEYEAYLDQLLSKLERGAIIVCDNLLWGGAVDGGEDDPSAAGLRKCNK